MRIHRVVVCSFASVLLASPRLPDHRPQVRVWVTRDSRVPVDIESMAREKARLLFARIGINIVYAENGDDAIPLRVVAMAPPAGNRYALGAACLANPPERRASVYYDRVVEFSISADPRKIAALLGYVMAHELGHILRDEPDHSPTGIMKANWTRVDEAGMITGFVGFTRSDVDRIFQVMAEARAVSVRVIE